MAANYLIPQGLHESIRKIHKRNLRARFGSVAYRRQTPAGPGQGLGKRPSVRAKCAIDVQFFAVSHPNAPSRKRVLPKIARMSQLTILEYPDPRLRTKAQPVAVFDTALQTLIDGMFETMYAAPGIGLAATQVNVHKQLLILDVSEERNQPLVLINPKIVAREEIGRAHV